MEILGKSPILVEPGTCSSLSKQGFLSCHYSASQHLPPRRNEPDLAEARSFLKDLNFFEKPRPWSRRHTPREHMSTSWKGLRQAPRVWPTIDPRPGTQWLQWHMLSCAHLGVMDDGLVLCGGPTGGACSSCFPCAPTCRQLKPDATGIYRSRKWMSLRDPMGRAGQSRRRLDGAFVSKPASTVLHPFA